MLKRLKLSFLFIVLFLSSSLLFSNTIIVDTTGAGDYTTIQEGIDVASDGDTVLVYPGTYYENINYNGKNITVASLYITTQADSFIHQTIIDGNQNGSVVTFESGEDSTAILDGFTIQNGSGTIYQYIFTCGGGIYCDEVNPTISNCIISNNTAKWGAGIHCFSSNIILKNVTICNNHAIFIGGGLCLRNSSTIIFDSNNRCNIYLNYSGVGSDIFLFDCNEITEIVADTFTVLNPDQNFVNTFFSHDVIFNIFNAKIEPVNQDLYVSPTGNDNNSGLSEEYPLKTISYALLKVASDSTHSNNIHLDEGIYSSSLTGERFPLNARSNIGIIGESEENSVLDGDNLYYLINSAFYDEHIRLENLTIQHGSAGYGAGIKFTYYSNGIVKNVTIKDNITLEGGDAGGLFCRDNSNPTFENVTIIENSAEVGGGVKIVESNPVFINCVVSENYTTNIDDWDGGISCCVETNAIFINTEIVNNTSSNCSGLGAGGGAGDFCDPTLINCTICDNSDNIYGTIEQDDNSNITMINCILRNYSQDEIVFGETGPPNSVTISYTNIDGGIDAINTNNNGTINWLEGNIDSDPMFVDTLNNNYQLQQGSPCIDAGTPDTTGLHLPETDLSGYPRIYNGRIDIGAYEWQGQGIDEPDTSFINKLYLFQNKPNPFSSSTTITFISADYERIKDYKLSIYNARGQLIKTYNGKQDNFWVKTDIVWDGTGEDGKRVSPGVYFYKLEYGFNAITRKMLLVK